MENSRQIILGRTALPFIAEDELEKPISALQLTVNFSHPIVSLEALDDVRERNSTHEADDSTGSCLVLFATVLRCAARIVANFDASSPSGSRKLTRLKSLGFGSPNHCRCMRNHTRPNWQAKAQLHRDGSHPDCDDCVDQGRPDIYAKAVPDPIHLNHPRLLLNRSLLRRFLHQWSSLQRY